MTAVKQDEIEVLAFRDNGSPVYAFQSTTGQYWDVCDCPDCTSISEDKILKKSSPGRRLKQRLANGDQHIGLLGQSLGKFDYIVKYSPPSNYGQLPSNPSGWIPEEEDDDLKIPAQKPKTSSKILPCYKQAQKWMQKHGEQFPEPSPT